MIDRAGRIGGIVIVALAGALLLGGTLWLLLKAARPDATPVIVARKDEKVAAQASETIGAQVSTLNHEVVIRDEAFTKEITDAFNAIPAVPVSVGGEPRLPAAPVERVRDRLNESIARANRAAGPARDPE